MATKLSANSIKNLLLAGQTVRVNKHAIVINKNDEVEIWPPKGRGFVASLLHLNKAVKQFMKLADLQLPGEINESMGDAVKVPDGVLGKDTTTDDPFDMPEINEQVRPSGNMSSTDLGKDTCTKNPFENPAVNKRPKSDWGLPDTDLGSDSSTDGGFDIPSINERPQIPDVKMSDTSLKSYAKRKRAFHVPIEEVDFDVNAEPEDMSPEDIFAGGYEPDAEIVDWIYNEQNRGNEWAWCQTQVIARWEDEDGKEYTGKSNWLGGCSYQSEEDFIQEGGYFDDMKNEAYEDLLLQIEDSDTGLKGIRPASRKISDTFSQEKAPSVYQEIRANRPSKALLDGILDEDAWTAKMTLGKMASDPFNVDVNDRPNQIDQKMSDPELTDGAEDIDMKAELDKRLASKFIIEMPEFKGKTFNSYNEAYDALSNEMMFYAEEEASRYSDSTSDVGAGEIIEEMAEFIKEAKAPTSAQKKANAFLANLWDQWVAGKRAKVLATLKKLGSAEVTKVFVSSLPEKDQRQLLKQAQDYGQMSIDQIVADLDAKGMYDPNMTLQQLLDTYGQQQVVAKKAQFEDEGYGGRVEELVESWINGNRIDVIEEVLQDTTLALEVYDALPESERQVFKMLRSIKMGRKNGQEELESDPVFSKDFKTMMNAFDELRSKWTEEFGSDDGFNKWFTEQMFKKGRSKKAGPKIREKWDDGGGYNRDIEAESAEELHALINGLSGEEVDWSVFRKDMTNDIQEEANPDGQPEGMVMAKTRRAQDKEAVDDKAKEYYKGYFGEYGKELAGDKSVTDKKPKGKDKKEVEKKGQAAPMPEDEPMPPAPAPGGAPAPKAPGAPAPGGAPPKAVPPKAPAAPAAGTGNDGLMALGWTQEEIQLMDDEDKQKILSAQVHKPGTKPKKAPKPAPAGQTPAPGGGAPQPPAPAPAGPPVAPGGQPPAQPKPMTPAASRKFANQMVEKLQVRKAQQMLQQDVPVTDVEKPQRLNLTSGQSKAPGQAPGQEPAPQAPAPEGQPAPGVAPMELSDESQAYRIVQEIQMQQIQASAPEQVPISKASLLAERLINDLGMTISEAKKLFGVQSLSALFK